MHQKDFIIAFQVKTQETIWISRKQYSLKSISSVKSLLSLLVRIDLIIEICLYWRENYRPQVHYHDIIFHQRQFKVPTPVGNTNMISCQSLKELIAAGTSNFLRCSLVSYFVWDWNKMWDSQYVFYQLWNNHKVERAKMKKSHDLQNKSSIFLCCTQTFTGTVL